MRAGVSPGSSSDVQETLACEQAPSGKYDESLLNFLVPHYPIREAVHVTGNRVATFSQRVPSKSMQIAYIFFGGGGGCCTVVTAGSRTSTKRGLATNLWTQNSRDSSTKIALLSKITIVFNL